jgi:hypothetical protein
MAPCGGSNAFIDPADRAEDLKISVGPMYTFSFSGARKTSSEKL